MTLIIECQVDDADVFEMLRGIQTRVRHMEPAWEVFAEAFRVDEIELFATEGASGGHPWAPLSPSYSAWKIMHAPGEPLLVLEGDLVDSLTERPFGVERIRAQDAEVGTDDETAGWHQHGTRNMPARPPVQMSETLPRVTRQAAAGWIVDGTP